MTRVQIGTAGEWAEVDEIWSHTRGGHILIVRWRGQHIELTERGEVIFWQHMTQDGPVAQQAIRHVPVLTPHAARAVRSMHTPPGKPYEPPQGYYNDPVFGLQKRPEHGAPEAGPCAWGMGV